MEDQFTHTTTWSSSAARKKREADLHASYYLTSTKLAWQRQWHISQKHNTNRNPIDHTICVWAIKVFANAKHTKMKEKLTPDAPGYHVSNKNCAIEVVGFNKNSTSIIVACFLSSHHLSIIEILIYLSSI